MSAQPADLYELLKKIRYDCTAIQGKVTDALKVLNELNLPDEPRLVCRHCLLPFGGPRSLADHLHVSHGGPLPDYEVALEALIEEAA